MNKLTPTQRVEQMLNCTAKTAETIAGRLCFQLATELEAAQKTIKKCEVAINHHITMEGDMRNETASLRAENESLKKDKERRMLPNEGKDES